MTFTDVGALAILAVAIAIILGHDRLQSFWLFIYSTVFNILTIAIIAKVFLR